MSQQEKPKQDDCEIVKRGGVDAGESYTKHMGSYPVINLTLKSAKQRSFDSAYGKIKNEIAEEYQRHQHVLECDSINEMTKRKFQKIANGEAGYDDYSGSLHFLSRCLYQATGKNAVILLDEYDVPLENAYFQGHYQFL